ncbi:serine/threonine protein kinase [Raoultibacter phocaeensis]|uniref:serine/threonine protein kinase n=1 Tax=Raoultibacter phocaeensis TaxID=2479841 RepID=UPI001119C7FD|nr:serine/threonine-protein kinase [Raoultibacter phocaeensis]
MTYDELSEHLNALQRDDCYRVDVVMKESPYEVTEKVYFVGANGSEQGPFVRKRIQAESSLGSAYESLYDAQKSGRRFSYIPRLVECYSTGDERIVVMEYVQGETLQEVVYRCDPSIALAVDLFPRICEAVRELHTSFSPPLIHRDLKPSNIMVSQDSLTVIDFGIARSFKAGAEADTKQFGTKAYAPPEQFGFGQTDERSDVYALGMLLYFCLTEKTPDAKARAASFSAPCIPERFRQVIERAVELDPADRFQSVEALMDAFAKVAGSVSPLAEPSVLQPVYVNGQSSNVPSRAVREEAARMGAGKAGGFLSRIPKGLGVAWDVFLLAVLALFVATAVRITIAPDPTSAFAENSLLSRALTYGSVLMLFFVPLLYVVSDRRPLKRFVPFLEKSSFLKDLVFFFACIVALFVAAMLIMTIP